MPAATDRPQASAPAEEAAPAAEKAPSSGGFKAWLPLIIVVVAMPALAYAMTTFVLLPKLQHGLGIEAAAAPAKRDSKKADPNAKKEYVTMNKLLVNVAGTMGSRYLLVSLSIVGTDADFKAKLAEREPELRAMACDILRIKTLADLEKPTAVNLIRTELISGFNNILGDSSVKEIYLTEFAIQ